MTLVETIDFGNGVTARVYHDPDAEQPFGDDEAVRIVILR